MVSRKQFDNLILPQRALGVAAIVSPGDAGHGVRRRDAQPEKFYADDPLLAGARAASRARRCDPASVDDIYDFLENSYVTPRREGKEAKRGPHPAANINTLGEVPDSSWYTNRHYFHRMSIEELQRGPGNSTPPIPMAPGALFRAKSDGVTPGFVIEDVHKNRYLLKFDPPQYPELCSAADVIGSKIFYALGYNTPENYVVHFRREDLEIGDGVMYRHPSGKKHPLTGASARRTAESSTKRSPTARTGRWRAAGSRARWWDRSAMKEPGVTIRMTSCLIRTGASCAACECSRPG